MAAFGKPWLEGATELERVSDDRDRKCERELPTQNQPFESGCGYYLVSTEADQRGLGTSSFTHKWSSASISSAKSAIRDAGQVGEAALSEGR